jgi:hypothetical protein
MFEIDHGDDEPKAQARTESAPRISDEDRAADARLRDARPIALAQIAQANTAQHLIDIEALVLAGLCGQGLGAMTRVETWGIGHSFGMLLTVAGIAGTVWMWRRTRLSAGTICAMPVPIDQQVVKRLEADGAERLAAERRRQEQDLAAIDLLSVELALYRNCLRLAVYGAAAGALCGWLAGAFGPGGAAVMAASAAALPGSLLGWRIAGGGWPALQIQRSVIGVLPAAAGLIALWCGTPILPVLGGVAVAVSAGLFWRQRLLALATPPGS